MIEQFTTLEELGGILGFSDIRSIKKWCYKNSIQVIRAGKKNYVLTALVDLHFSRECEKFFSATSENKLAIMDAIKANNRIELVDLLDAPTIPVVRKNFSITKKHSPQTNKFLQNINSAI